MNGPIANSVTSRNDSSRPCASDGRKRTAAWARNQAIEDHHDAPSDPADPAEHDDRLEADGADVTRFEIVVEARPNALYHEVDADTHHARSDRTDHPCPAECVHQLPGEPLDLGIFGLGASARPLVGGERHRRPRQERVHRGADGIAGAGEPGLDRVLGGQHDGDQTPHHVQRQPDGDDPQGERPEGRLGDLGDGSQRAGFRITIRGPRSVRSPWIAIGTASTPTIRTRCPWRPTRAGPPKRPQDAGAQVGRPPETCCLRRASGLVNIGPPDRPDRSRRRCPAWTGQQRRAPRPLRTSLTARHRLPRVASLVTQPGDT